MNETIPITARPRVRFVGQFDHPDFADAIAMLRNDARLVASSYSSPELIIVAQSRPGMIADRTIQSLRREAPLAGLISLLGAWCEGETRTGRPWPGVERFYWYEFPAWWRRQLALRAAGCCPDWARPFDSGLRCADCELTNPAVSSPTRGLIVLNTSVRDTAFALADVFQVAGFATLWQSGGRPTPVIRGITAGIWDGGQLSEREETSLATFCRAISLDAAPVIAMLDFPRRDRCERARKLGAAAILGKPLLNADLVGTIEEFAGRNTIANRAA